MKTPIVTRIRREGIAASDGLLVPAFVVDGQGEDGRWYPYGVAGTIADAQRLDATIPPYWEQVA